MRLISLNCSIFCALFSNWITSQSLGFFYKNWCCSFLHNSVKFVFQWQIKNQNVFCFGIKMFKCVAFLKVSLSSIINSLNREQIYPLDVMSSVSYVKHSTHLFFQQTLFFKFRVSILQALPWAPALLCPPADPAVSLWCVRQTIQIPE